MNPARTANIDVDDGRAIFIRSEKNAYTGTSADVNILKGDRVLAKMTMDHGALCQAIAALGWALVDVEASQKLLNAKRGLDCCDKGAVWVEVPGAPDERDSCPNATGTGAECPDCGGSLISCGHVGNMQPTTYFSSCDECGAAFDLARDADGSLIVVERADL